MKLEQAKKLLERYYNGETSLEEEQALASFFQEVEVPEELKIDQAQFLFYQAARKEGTHNNYSYTGTIVKKLRPTLFQLTMGIAASLLLISGSFYLFKNWNTDAQKLTAQELAKSEQAYAETKKALLLISEKFNKGTKEFNKISKLNEVQNSIIQQ